MGPPCACPPKELGFEDQSERWHVLNNIEYSYNTRRIDHYDELLDAEFRFFFAPGDVKGGAPESWDGTEEWEATARLFRSNSQTDPPQDPICLSMRLDIPFVTGEIEWVEFIPAEYPTEKWYSATLFYVFTFEIHPDMTYIARSGAKAEFVVRNHPQDGKDHWELVELRDLGGTIEEPAAAASVAEATWGGIKRLYDDGASLTLRSTRR